VVFTLQAKQATLVPAEAVQHVQKLLDDALLDYNNFADKLHQLQAVCKRRQVISFCLGPSYNFILCVQTPEASTNAY
jgi:hypothetical protein